MTTNKRTFTDELLSPSVQNVLSADNEARKKIPFDIRQKELGRMGLLAESNDLPAAGEKVDLNFSDGHTSVVTVTGYSKPKDQEVLAQVEIPFVDHSVQSNIQLQAFDQLREPK